jgi:hypothetical protein
VAYRIAGRYFGSCNCKLVCPCPYDGPPTGPGDQCLGAGAFEIRNGSLDDTDLSGVRWAYYIHLSSNYSAGNWKIGLLVDDTASDEQSQAVERIVSGQEGGPFGEMAALIGEYAGMERASVSLSDDRASIGGIGEFTYEPFTGPDGSPTTVRGAMFGFAPEFGIGRSSGRLTIRYGEIECVYGEAGDYEFSSEMAAEDVRPRA